jgi:hypothetical protein
VILEALTGPDRPWDDLHHRSYFLPELRRIEAREFVSTMNGDNLVLSILWLRTQVYAEGNMESITTMIPIDISKTPGETMTLFIFNQIVARFNIPKEIVTDHGSHFQNKMMTELTSNLGLRQEHSSPYYPQANGQVEAVNKSLKTILQRMINSAKSNWHLMLYSTLWAYRTSVKTATSFSPFQLVYSWKQSYLLSVRFLL